MLSQKEMDAFFSDGYLIVTLEIRHNILERIIHDAAFKFKEQNANLNHHGARIQDLWIDSFNVKHVALLPQILKIIQTLYKRKPLPFQTLNFHLGTQQKLHSDTIHFNSFPNNFMCGVWVALEDIDENNGPINYCPGSHLLPEINMQNVGKGITYDNYKYYEEYIENLVTKNKLKTENAILQKGQAIIWHGNLLHGGSHHIDKSRTRHSMVTHYYFEDCKYYTPMLSTPEEIYYRNPNWIKFVAIDRIVSNLDSHLYKLKESINILPCAID